MSQQRLTARCPAQTTAHAPRGSREHSGNYAPSDVPVKNFKCRKNGKGARGAILTVTVRSAKTIDLFDYAESQETTSGD